MKDNLPNIWHKHDGCGMHIFLENDDFEVKLRNGIKLINHHKGWAWMRPPGSDIIYDPHDVVAWRYIVSEKFERKEKVEKVMEAALNVPEKEDEMENRLTKYQKLIRGVDINGHVASVVVDVYDVLTAWEVQNPALQHLIKKALQPGERGHKSLTDDLKDIIASAQRALELAKGEMK